MTMWRTEARPQGIVAVWPLADAIEHEVDSDECVCGPTSELVRNEDGPDGWLLTHHALDGRA